MDGSLRQNLKYSITEFAVWTCVEIPNTADEQLHFVFVTEENANQTYFSTKMTLKLIGIRFNDMEFNIGCGCHLILMVHNTHHQDQMLIDTCCILMRTVHGDKMDTTLVHKHGIPRNTDSMYQCICVKKSHCEVEVNSEIYLI